MSEGGLYWVEHEELGYAPGICIGETEEALELQCDDGLVVSLAKNKAQPVHRNSLLGVPNLLELGDYNMPALLHNVRVRYSKNEFYSSIGLPILISVNPYKSIPHLYDQATKLQYMTATINEPPPHNTTRQASTSSGSCSNLEDIPDRKLFISKPHLFATAQMTYSALIRNKQAQSIVISGESGAGKTEATKILLKYFSELEFGGKTDRSSMGDCIERYILNSNPILESFGNAKTVRNDNSSRFGRFIQIYFDLVDTHRIKCGRISHYLLEKCRLISLYQHERNFHIFYQLSLGGVSNPYYNKKLIEWGILPEEDHGGGGDDWLINTLLQNFPRILGNDPDVWYLGNEVELFSELVSCMVSVGFPQEEVDSIFTIIAALMHLSKLNFSPIKSPDAAYTDGMPLSYIDDITPLKKVCQLLQIKNIPSIIPASIRDPVMAFSDILLFKVLRNVETTHSGAGGLSGQWIRTPRDPHHASQVRDSIIKEIYSRLFDWIIKKINKALINRGGAGVGASSAGGAIVAATSTAGLDNELSLGSNLVSDNRLGTAYSSSKYKWSARKQSCGVQLGGRNATPPIGLLDIYGFEVFEGRNSFEQLCINYANEKLQQHFNQHVLSLEQATYRKEAIDWSDILFTDNRDIIRALEEPPHGVFVILDDTRITDKNRDQLFLQEIERRGIKPVVSTPVKKGTTFIVKHYAGDVQYCAQGFVEKNVDKLEAQSAYFLSKASTKHLIKDLFLPYDHDSASTTSSAVSAADELMLRRNSLKATLGVEFRNQLNQLIQSLTSTTPTYVRCIKPNGLKQPGLFHSKDVLRQLEYAGLLESIRIRNSGFGVRSTFLEFLDDYIIILKKQYPLYRKSRLSLSADQLKQLCVQLLLFAENTPTKHTTANQNQDLKARNWQIGRTKIFMKEEVQTSLEQARSVRRLQAATVIEAVARRYLARQRFLRLKNATVKIQALARGFLTRYHVRRHKAAVVVQTYWSRTRPTRQWFLGVKHRIRFIQTWWRYQLYKKSVQMSKTLSRVASHLPRSLPTPGRIVTSNSSLPPADPSIIANETVRERVAAAPRRGNPLQAGHLLSIGSAGARHTGNSNAPLAYGLQGPASFVAAGHSEPHVSSMETIDDYPSSTGRPVEMAAGQRRRRPGHLIEPTIENPNELRRRRKKYDSSENEDELTSLYAMRKRSVNKGHAEYNYEATIHMMFSELTTKLRKTEKENKKMRMEITKIQNECSSRVEELNKLKGEKTALEMEMEERDRVAITELETLVQTNESLQMKLRNIRNLNQGIEAVLTDMANYANDRLRGVPDCDLVRDFSSYVKGCCSRGFDFLRSAMYQMSLDHDVIGETYSPRYRNTPPPPFLSDGSRGGVLSCRFSRIGEDDILPSSSGRTRHYHRQRRNESIYDDNSSFGVEESSRRGPPTAGQPNQPRREDTTTATTGVVPFLRNTVSAYKPRNPYMQLGGKTLDTQWSTGGAPANDINSQYDNSERRMPYR